MHPVCGYVNVTSCNCQSDFIPHMREIPSRIITSPCRPDRLWGPPKLLYNGYRELFPGGKTAWAGS
jgi:hypothetical protein